MVFDNLHAAVQAGYSHVFAKYPDHHAIILICGTFLIHQFFYYSFYLPYIVVDAFPVMRKNYKIQAHKPNTAALHWNCLKTLLKNNFLSQLPMIVMVPLLFKFTRMSYTDPIPAFTTVGLHLLVSIILEDAWHYWAHRSLHHWSFLYRKIHKMHHEHTAPFGITAEYASHFETMILGVGTMLGPLILQQHYFTMICWLALRVVQTIDAHSGYDLPWSPHNLIPFYGGALYHDFHHSNIKGNYSSTFTWWDKMIGTDVAFKRHQVRCGGKRAIGVAKDALTEVSEK